MKLNKPYIGRTTALGAKGYKRDPKQELFLRATTMFYGEGSFHEKADQNTTRLIQLGREQAVGDQQWFADFVFWLRHDANIRTAAIVLAAEGVHARLAAKVVTLKGTSNRKLISGVLLRPDEPGELVSYWINTYGRDLPMPVKRGVGDAVKRMYNERQALRYDKSGNAVRFGDVVELTHPKPQNDGQGKLFEHLITDRHNRDGYSPPFTLTAIRARHELNQLSADDRQVFAALVQSGDQAALSKWQLALAGQWEWGRSWLGAK
jgi:hypothetical protein